jgi:hypothetical protein
MLTRILKAFHENQDLLDINQLSRMLEIEPGALQGMLEHLVQLGKLEKETTGVSCSQGCSQCSVPDCMLASAATAQIRWKLKT